MTFLAVELWPYIAAALAIGIATGWFSGCSSPGERSTAETEEPTS